MTQKFFLILKRGLYYRPNAQGYTSIIRDAGRFTEAEAIAHRDSCAPGELELVEASEPMTMDDIPEDIKTKARAALSWSGYDINETSLHFVTLAIWEERERCARIVEAGLGRSVTAIARMIREGGA